MKNNITVTMPMSEYEEMQDRIKLLEQRDIMSFLKYIRKDEDMLKGVIIGQSLDLDKIMAYLEENVDGRYDLFIQVDEDRMKLTDHEDESDDCGTF